LEIQAHIYFGEEIIKISKNMKRRKRDLHKLTSSSSMNSRIEEEEEEEEPSRERGSAVEYYANEIRLFFIHLYNKSSEAGEEEQPVKGI
jgi:hypothetical protein